MNITIPQATFDDNVASLKAFYKSQGVFSDIDFEGSHISALVDGLAYNTSISQYYYSMAVNETRRSTARLRNNVIARAQENGYIPKSFTSASAVVRFTINSNNVNRPTVVIPSGTVVTGAIDNRIFTFATTEPVVTSAKTTTGNTVSFTTDDIVVTEGIMTSDSFVMTPDSDTFEISNQQVDISSITVTVVENQSTTTPYQSATSVVGVGPTDPVYFIRVGPNGNYTIYFGDGNIGKRPADQAIVVVTYRISNGQLANGIIRFIPGQTIDGESNVSITTVTGSIGGDVYEDTDSIRFNGDQANLTQNRSTYQDDFANDVRNAFPIISDISVIGGETVYPPQYGKVLITAVDKNLNNLSQLQIDAITAFLQKRVPTTTRFAFNKANIIRVGVETAVRSDKTTSPAVIRTNVVSAVEQFATSVIGKFGKNLYKTRLTSAIDNADPAILSNATSLTVLRTITTGQQSTTNIGNRITRIKSLPFTYNAVQGTLADIEGQVFVVNDQNIAISSPIGTIDYVNGIVDVLAFNQTDNQAFDLIIYPTDNDLIATGSAVFKILSSDITVK